MFPSLATQGNMFGNNVSAAMFASVTRPLVDVMFDLACTPSEIVWCFCEHLRMCYV